MWARLNDDGTLSVPMAAVSDDGDVIGDGMVIIGPDDHRYEEYLAEAQLNA